MKDNNSCPAVLSTKMSMCGKGKSDQEESLFLRDRQVLALNYLEFDLLRFLWTERVNTIYFFYRSQKIESPFLSIRTLVKLKP